MKLLKLLPAALILLSYSLPALADAPSLQVSPLSYRGALHTGQISQGYVDVANPTDETIQVTSNIQGFRQTGTKGNLSFFNDQTLSNAVTVSLTSFSLGPREAVRDFFTVDPSKLPQGGIYGVIFFQTQTPAQQSGSSYVIESANVGTLLILTNGGQGAHRGQIQSTQIPFLQIGSGLTGTLFYQNTDQSNVAVAFTPKLNSSVLPWGKHASLTTGLVLPGVSREFTLSRPGSFFGLLPVTITDAASGGHVTAWVLADTGAYQYLVPIIVVLLFVLFFALKGRLASINHLVKRVFTRRKTKPVVRRSLDGLAPRPKPIAPKPAPEPESQGEEVASDEITNDNEVDLEVATEPDELGADEDLTLENSEDETAE